MDTGNMNALAVPTYGYWQCGCPGSAHLWILAVGLPWQCPPMDTGSGAALVFGNRKEKYFFLYCAAAMRSESAIVVQNISYCKNIIGFQKNEVSYKYYFSVCTNWTHKGQGKLVTLKKYLPTSYKYLLVGCKTLLVCCKTLLVGCKTLLVCCTTL